MKPNLFRSISNSLAESFPLLPRIRRSFIGLLIFCCTFLLIGLTTEDFIIYVEPLENTMFAHKDIIAYPAGNIELSGKLVLKNVTIADRILLSSVSTKFDLFTMIFMVIGSVIIILIAPKLHQQNLFRKDISNTIRLLGYLIMLHGVLNTIRIVKYIPEKIEVLTNHQFTNTGTFPNIIWAELYFSLVILALAGMYQRGIKLQEEYDLTV